MPRASSRTTLERNAQALYLHSLLVLKDAGASSLQNFYPVGRYIDPPWYGIALPDRESGTDSIIYIYYY